MTATRSPTPKVSTRKPSRRCASTLSPSVTATSRMLSPKRAIRPVSQSRFAAAARVQAPMRSWTSVVVQWPTTTLRSRRSRAAMNPNSRSPWAAWLRFMKSMSIASHGISPWYCVCRWRSGRCRAVSPPIHILAGENVCIQAMTPTQAGFALASRNSARIPSASVTTGFGDDPDRDRRRRVEGRGDLGGVRRHGLERLRPVEVLAAGDEPDLVRPEVAHGRTPPLAGHWPYSVV